MSEDAKIKKEIQERKREFQEKKVDLISQLCAGETREVKDKEPVKNKR